MGARKHLRNPCPLLSLTTLPGFLDGLGQLLVLLHTDPCVWGVKDDTRVCTDKLFQELHILQERDKQMCEGLVKTSVG